MAYTDLYNQYFGGRQQEPDTEANVTPTSTTINYNEDGSHDITHKVNVAPVAPPEGPSPAPVAETPVPPPVTPPPITPTPAANQILSQPPQQGPAVPQAAPQVPTPGTAQMNPAMPTAPVAPPAPGEAAMAQAPAEQLQQPPAPPAQPVIAGNPSTDIGATPTEQAIDQPGSVHAQNLQDWQNDPTKTSLIAGDRRTPEQGGPEIGTKIMANKIVGEHYTGEQKKREEQKRVDDMIANNDTVGLANAMKRREEGQGSYFLAYLFNRLGMHGLAAQEEVKLGAGSTMEQVTMPDGSTALVRVRKDGSVSYGHDLETGKELNAKELEGIAGQVTNTKTAQTQAVHAYTTEKSRLEKLRDESMLNGATEAELKRDGLDDANIEAKARKTGNDVMVASRSKYFGAPKEIAMPGAAGQAQTNMNRTEKQGMEVTPAGSKIAAPSWAFDNGMPIISGHRTKDQQASQISYYDADGTARTSTGRPVAVPGTSKHETYDAFDVDPAKMTPELERVAREAGFKNDIKGDSNHWYRERTTPGDVTTTPKIEKEKDFSANWQRRRENEPRAAWLARQKVSGAEVDDLGRGLVDGTIVPGDLTGRDTNVRRFAIERAKELEPGWSVSDAISRRDALKRFTNPDSKTSQTIRGHVTAAGAFHDVEDAFDALHNGDTKMFNQFKNKFEEETGKSFPVNARTNAMLLGPELIKSIIPGGGGVSERLEAKGLLGTDLSPSQQKAVFNTIKEFQGNSLLGLQNDWTKAGLKKDQFRSRMLGDSPDTQDLLDYSEKKRSGRREAATNPPPASKPGLPSPDEARRILEERRKARGH